MSRKSDSEKESGASDENSTQETCLNKSIETFLNGNVNDRRTRSASQCGSWDSVKLPEKVFTHRESLLTELLKVTHIQTVYHIALAMLLVLAMDVMIGDYMEHGNLIKLYRLDSLSYTFGKAWETFFIWLSMLCSTVLVLQTAKLWINMRPHVDQITMIDWIFLVGYISYQLAFLLIPAYLVFRLNLPPGSSTIVTCEQIRMIMKWHAFVSSTIHKVFRAAQKEKPTPKFTTYRHYIYFLFAPTLVYRDHYPTTDHIRWDKVRLNALQTLFSISYSYFILSKFLISRYANYTPEKFCFKGILTSMFSLMLPAGLIYFNVFFGFLHSWQNLFAELLCFGDRLFYKDWWNSMSYSAYYRTWNTVVHDWLYTYVYVDSYRLLHSKLAASAIVFFISAFVHEYIICLSFKFFYPVMLIQFGGAGFLLTFVKGRRRLSNIYFWVSMIVGLGFQMSLYGLEWYARRICKPLKGVDQVQDFFLPRSLLCEH